MPPTHDHTEHAENDERHADELAHVLEQAKDTREQHQLSRVAVLPLEHEANERELAPRPAEQHGLVTADLDP